MAQANLKYLVEDADLRVQRTRRCVDRQREAVSTLEQGGQDATLAKRLLTISEKAFEIHVADRVRLSQKAGRAVARGLDILDRQDKLARVKSDSLERFPTYQPRLNRFQAEKRP
jgi:hypothetical protein